MPVYGFNKQKDVGDDGENTIKEYYKGLAEHIGGRRADYKLLNTPDLFELKTDTWDMAKTPNFFIERYSNMNKKNPGGPFQALTEHKCKYFAYLFRANKTLFWFNTQKLIDKTEELVKIHNLKLKLIKNSDYDTGGYLIKREWVKDISKEVLMSDKPDLSWLPLLD